MLFVLFRPNCMSRRELRVQNSYSHECKDVIQQFQLDQPEDASA